MASPENCVKGQEVCVIKTFLDSGVLMAAWRGTEDQASAALSCMEDANREFYTAQMVKLELLPKAHFYHKPGELEIYEPHFARTKKEEPLSESLGRDAMRLAKKHGVSAADALNIAAAIRLGVEEFFTSEHSQKPLFRVPGIKVISIAS